MSQPYREAFAPIVSLVQEQHPHYYIVTWQTLSLLRPRSNNYFGKTMSNSHPPADTLCISSLLCCNDLFINFFHSRLYLNQLCTANILHRNEYRKLVLKGQVFLILMCLPSIRCYLGICHFYCKYSSLKKDFSCFLSRGLSLPQRKPECVFQ